MDLKIFVFGEAKFYKLFLAGNEWINPGKLCEIERTSTKLVVHNRSNIVGLKSPVSASERFRPVQALGKATVSLPSKDLFARLD